MRTAEFDLEGAGHSDSISQWQPFEEEPNATGHLLTAYERIHQLDKLAYHRLVTLREAQREVRRIQSVLKRSEVGRRLESLIQQVSADSTDLADGLAAVIADRDAKMTASKNMLNMQKDKTSRISKERDYYRTELDTLKALITTEREEAAKTTASTIGELRQQLDTESACKRAARLEAAHLRITMEERDNASAARPQEHANAQGSSATSDTSAMGVDHPTVGTTSTSPVSAQVASPISSAAGARHTTVGTILPPRTPAPAAISAVSRELAWSVLDPRVQEQKLRGTIHRVQSCGMENGPSIPFSTP